MQKVIFMALDSKKQPLEMLLDLFTPKESEEEKKKKKKKDPFSLEALIDEE